MRALCWTPSICRRSSRATCIGRSIAHRPRAIGIIDGYFQQVPSVWHKEILWAMAQGVHVFGSASMGALRARRARTRSACAGSAGSSRPIATGASHRMRRRHSRTTTRSRWSTGGRGWLRSPVGSDGQHPMHPGIRRGGGCHRGDARDTLVPAREGALLSGSLVPAASDRGAKHGLPVADLDALRAWLPTGSCQPEA